MLFEKSLMPDYMFGSFRDITPDFMKSIGAKALISDIDNTLVPYEVEEATDEIVNWISSLKNSGISIALVSNNKVQRVEKFNEKIRCPAFADVRKPSVKYILKACSAVGVEPKHALFLGDQLLTDALAAKRCNMLCAVVPPIKDKQTLFFKFKRLLEKPYINKFNREHLQ